MRQRHTLRSYTVERHGRGRGDGEFSHSPSDRPRGRDGLGEEEDPAPSPPVAVAAGAGGTYARPHPDSLASEALLGSRPAGTSSRGLGGSTSPTGAPQLRHNARRGTMRSSFGAVPVTAGGAATSPLSSGGPRAVAGPSGARGPSPLSPRAQEGSVDTRASALLAGSGAPAPARYSSGRGGPGPGVGVGAGAGGTRARAVDGRDGSRGGDNGFDGEGGGVWRGREVDGEHGRGVVLPYVDVDLDGTGPVAPVSPYVARPAHGKGSAGGSAAAAVDSGGGGGGSGPGAGRARPPGPPPLAPSTARTLHSGGSYAATGGRGVEGDSSASDYSNNDDDVNEEEEDDDNDDDDDGDGEHGGARRRRGKGLSDTQQRLLAMTLTRGGSLAVGGGSGPGTPGPGTPLGPGPTHGYKQGARDAAVPPSPFSSSPGSPSSLGKSRIPVARCVCVTAACMRVCESASECAYGCVWGGGNTCQKVLGLCCPPCGPYHACTHRSPQGPILPAAGPRPPCPRMGTSQGVRACMVPCLCLPGLWVCRLCVGSGATCRAVSGVWTVARRRPRPPPPRHCSWQTSSDSWPSSSASAWHKSRGLGGGLDGVWGLVGCGWVGGWGGGRAALLAYPGLYVTSRARHPTPLLARPPTADQRSPPPPPYPPPFPTHPFPSETPPGAPTGPCKGT
jgi:hypothetical protein